MINYSRSIILIPTLNEKENLENLIPQIFGLMPDISILVVDDNSSDGTSELIKSLAAKFKNLFLLERKANFGYGRSSIDGFIWVLKRSYDFLVTMDADFSHDFRVVPLIIEDLKNSDVVVGSRYVRGGQIKNWNLSRRILSKFANFYVGVILGLPIRDVTTGFNGYRTGALKKLNLKEIKSEGYSFLVELKFRLFKASLKIIEQPIVYSERREGQSKMSYRNIWEAVWLPWKLTIE